MKEFKKFWEETSKDNEKIIGYIIKLYVNRKKTIDVYSELSKLSKTVDHRDYFKKMELMTTKHNKQLDKLIADLGKKYFSVFSVQEVFWDNFNKIEGKKYTSKLNKIYWNEHFFIKRIKVLLTNKNTSDIIKKALKPIYFDLIEERYYLSKISDYRLHYKNYLDVLNTKEEIKEEKTYHYDYQDHFGY